MVGTSMSFLVGYHESGVHLAVCPLSGALNSFLSKILTDPIFGFLFYAKNITLVLSQVESLRLRDAKPYQNREC